LSRQRQLCRERFILDALRCPVGLKFAGGHTPDLLVIRLEEVIKKTLSETVCDPVLKALFGFMSAEDFGDADFGSRPEIGGHTSNRFDDAQIFEGIGRFEWVVEVLPVVEDAAHSGPHEEILIRQDFVPKIFNRLDLGEEAMAAQIKAPPINFDGSGNSADGVGRFKDGAGAPGL